MIFIAVAGGLRASEDLNTSQAFVSLEVLRKSENRSDLMREVSRCIQILRTLSSCCDDLGLNATEGDSLKKFADSSEKILKIMLGRGFSFINLDSIQGSMSGLIEAITKKDGCGTIAWVCRNLAIEVANSICPYITAAPSSRVVSEWTDFLRLNLSARRGFVDFSEFTRYRGTSWWNRRIEYNAQMMYALIILGHIFFPAVQAEILLDAVYNETILDEVYDRL